MADEALKELRDSIQAFERARESRKRISAAAPVPAVASAAPVAPGAATAPDEPDPIAESIAQPTPVPPSDRTSSVDAEGAGAETVLPETAATTGPGEDTANAESGTAPDEPKNGSTGDGGLTVGPARPGRFAIQVGAYDREPQATALAERLTAKNYPAYVAESRGLEDRVPGPDRWVHRPSYRGGDGPACHCR